MALFSGQGRYKIVSMQCRFAVILLVVTSQIAEKVKIRPP